MDVEALETALREAVAPTSAPPDSEEALLEEKVAQLTKQVAMRDEELAKLRKMLT